MLQSAVHVVQVSPLAAWQVPSPQVVQAPQSDGQEAQDSSVVQLPLPQVPPVQSEGQVSCDSLDEQVPSPQVYEAQEVQVFSSRTVPHRVPVVPDTRSRSVMFHVPAAALPWKRSRSAGSATP